jgi:hypothetical protein
MSKALCLSTKGLLLKSKALCPSTNGLLLESKTLRLESKVLFVEPQDLLRNGIFHSRTTKGSEVNSFVPLIYSSAKGAMSFGGG